MLPTLALVFLSNCICASVWVWVSMPNVKCLVETHELHHCHMRQITPTMPPLVVSGPSPHSSLIWVLVNLELSFFYSNEDLMIYFVWVLNVGFGYDHL